MWIWEKTEGGSGYSMALKQLHAVLVLVWLRVVEVFARGWVLPQSFLMLLQCFPKPMLQASAKFQK